MTHKRYLACRELRGEAVITHLGDDGKPFVQLTETLFHPQGGGQKADRGTLGERPVTHVVHAENGEVNHYVDSTDGWQVGDTLTLEIDTDWRTLNARWHTAGHLIATIGEQLAPALTAVSGHHWSGEGRVEFTPADAADSALLAERLPTALAEAIAADWPVTVVGDPFSSREVKVGDGRPVGCGGTHLTSVADLQNVTITGIKTKSGKLRVSYSL